MEGPERAREDERRGLTDCGPDRCMTIEEEASAGVDTIGRGACGGGAQALALRQVRVVEEYV